jgi:hypothetical protein
MVKKANFLSTALSPLPWCLYLLSSPTDTFKRWATLTPCLSQDKTNTRLVTSSSYSLALIQSQGVVRYVRHSKLLDRGPRRLPRKTRSRLFSRLVELDVGHVAHAMLLAEHPVFFAVDNAKLKQPVQVFSGALKLGLESCALLAWNKLVQNPDELKSA